MKSNKKKAPVKKSAKKKAGNKLKNIGANVLKFMLKKELNQTELAEKAKLTQAALSQVISGVRIPSLQTAINLTEALSVKFEDLVK